MSAEPGTSIALLCMNKPGTLRQTIDSLEATLRDPYEVIVVDNGSTDATTLELLSRQESRGWRIIRNNRNLGLSVGVNQGLAAGKYDCLIHMDDDCLIKARGWNLTMYKYLQGYTEVGLVVPGKSRESIQHKDYQEIRWGLGMCWGMKKALFEDIGGYDPQLYHQNECDLALRVRMAGLRVIAIDDFSAIHNDHHRKSEMGSAREHIGVVQFRDKWTAYFMGRNWNYGTTPVSLMEHWPPDQEWYRRYSLAHGVNLNPSPAKQKPSDSAHDHWVRVDALAGRQKIQIGFNEYLIFRGLRSDYTFWYEGDGYLTDRQKAIDRWFELTGERYEGYRWPNLLRV